METAFRSGWARWLDNADANVRRLIYELDDKGGDELRSRDVPYSRKKYLRNFAHELMACTIAASFEIGAASNPAIRIIGWHELIDSPQMPAATKQLTNPRAIPFARDGRHEEIASDWQPFVIERSIAAKSYIFIAGFEADCGTEPIDTTDTVRSSIRNKFAAYLACLEQDVPRRHFGATTFTIPFITTTEARILHDPGAQRPHDLDDPFFDPKVQSRIAGVIADNAQKKN